MAGQIAAHEMHAPMSPQLLLRLQCRSWLIASLPEFLIEDAVATGALVPVLPAWVPSPVEMTALWQKDRITGRLIKAIVGAFEQALRVKPAEV